jgi:O-antigen/teichoic acid export membrane protein
MFDRLHQLRRWAGVDRAVFFSSAAQVVRLITGPITMALVLRYLTPEIQGYFYAFAGVAAMQVFLEMGFSQNIFQFASHEYARLHFTGQRTLEGDPVALSRLSSLARLSFRYYAVAALIFLAAIGVGGHIFFAISSTRFSTGSFKNPAALALRLQRQSDPAAQFVCQNLTAPTRAVLTNYLAGQSAEKKFKAALSRDLNVLLAQTSLYPALNAAHVQFRPETEQLREQNPRGRGLAHLNRLVLEDAFPEIMRSDVAWQGAWWLIAITAALSLAINPAWSLLEGCNQIAILSQFRFWASLGVFGAVAVALVAGAGIYASGIGAAFNLLVSAIYLGSRWRPFLRQCLEHPRHGRVSWSREIWPFQWRIATSWMSNYFIFEIINPVAFFFCGPVEAGRLGMSVQLVYMIARIALTWTNTKAPRLSMLIATRAWRQFDALLRHSTIQVVSIYLLGYFSFLAALLILSHTALAAHVPLLGHVLSKVPGRLAPFSVNVWLGASQITALLVSSMCLELRAHKRDPLVWMSVLNAVLSIALMVPFARLWGISGEVVGYTLALWAVFLPSYKIYQLKRREYRSQANDLAEPPSSAVKVNRSGTELSGLEP